jgi:GNAT superfamily N-acetyltransferase
MPTVRPATSADLPAVGRALAAAFAGDPVWGHLASPKADWDARAAAWFATDAKAQMDGHGEVLVDEEMRGAAIWASPGHWRAGLSETLAVVPSSVRLFRSRTVRALRTLSTIESRHPRHPHHWYLAMIGTDPAHQGSGVGSALINAVLERCDAEGLPAYLESSKAANVPYYARFGFVEQDAIDLPAGGPKMWPMWREPKA